MNKSFNDKKPIPNLSQPNGFDFLNRLNTKFSAKEIYALCESFSSFEEFMEFYCNPQKIAKNSLEPLLKLIDSYSTVFDVLGSIYIFYKDFQSSSTISDYVRAAISYLMKFYKAKDAIRIFSFIWGSKLNFEPQSLGDIVDDFKMIRDSELATKLNQVLTGLTCAGLISHLKLPITKEGMNMFSTRYAGNYSFKGVDDMLLQCLDLCRLILDVGYECFLEKSIRPLMTRNRDARVWLDDVDNLLVQYSKQPLEEHPDPQAFLLKIDDLLDRSSGIDIDKQVLSLSVRDLRRIRSEFMRKHNVSSYRKSPFSVLVYGTPGIGKTSITNMLYTLYHRVVTERLGHTLDWDPKVNMYTRNFADDYWSGYKGASQWAVTLDDIARENANHVASKGSDSLTELITVVNTVGVATTQAALEDKGGIPLLPRMVVATTNCKNLNAHHAVHDSGAVLRRLPYVIEPVVKPQYLDGNGMLKKCSAPEFDMWDYKVSVVVLRKNLETGKQFCAYEPFIPNPSRENPELVSGAELCKFLTNKILEHETSSDVMKESMKVQTNATLCQHSVLSTIPCEECNNVSFEPQSFTPEGYDNILPLLGVGSLVLLITRYSMLLDIILLIFSIIFLMYNGMNYIQYYYPIISGRRITTSWFLHNQYVPTWVLIFAYQRGFINHSQFLDSVKRRIIDPIPAALRENRQALLSLVLGVTAFFQLRKIWKFEPQAVENVWKKDDTIFSVPAKASSLSEVINTVKAGLIRLHVHDKNDSSKRTQCTAMCIGNNRYVTVQHPFYKGTSWQCAASVPSKIEGNFNSSCEFQLEEFQLHRLPNDLVVFSTSAILPRKNLFSFLPTEIDTAGRRIHILGLSTKATLCQSEGILTQIDRVPYTSDYGESIEGEYAIGTKDHPSRRGDCGSVFLASSHGKWFIHSIHCAGVKDRNIIVGSRVAQGMFKDIEPVVPMADFSDYNLFKNGSKKSGALGRPQNKNIADWVNPNSKALFLGCYKLRSTMKSRTRPTCISYKVQQQFGIENNYAAPLMKPCCGKDGWLNPYVLAANDQGKISYKFLESEVLLAASNYKTRYGGKINFDLSPLCILEAINGRAGQVFMDRIPMSTSGGFFFPGPKRNYFDKSVEGQDTIYVMGNDVYTKYNEIVNYYSKGQRACVLFQASLKDEAIKKEKVALGKTRVFTACDVAFSIVVRQYFLPITSYIMQNNQLSECYAGMNCYDTNQWGKLYEYMCAFGPSKVLAGDYKRFDKGMPAMLIRHAFQILIDLISENCQLSPLDKKIMIGVATDISFPIVNLNGDVVQFFGSNSSGHPLTVIINSIVNSLYVRIAYNKIIGELDSFDSNVHLATLGDDNLMSSNIAKFNHTSLSEALSELGIVYTMADKSSESVPFLDISQVDFLKRKFVLRGTDIIAPLDLNSIFKSLMMLVEKGNIEEEEQIAQVYLAARREWALHGRKVFDTYTQKMDIILKSYPLIKKFFIQQTQWNFDKTYEWTLGRLKISVDKRICSYLDNVFVAQSGDDFVLDEFLSRFEQYYKNLWKNDWHSTSSYYLAFNEFYESATLRPEEQSRACDRCSETKCDLQSSLVLDSGDQFMEDTHGAPFWIHHISSGNIIVPFAKQAAYVFGSCQQEDFHSESTCTHIAIPCVDISANTSCDSGGDNFSPVTLQFEPQSSGAVISEDMHNDSTMHSKVMNSDEPKIMNPAHSLDANLDEFLGRRVVIHRATWAVGSALNFTINPWFLFLNNPALKRKLDNFLLVKGDLQLTIMINGTPFHAGMGIMSYLYLNNEQNPDVNSYLTTRSQRPNVLVNASTSKGGCLCVPLIIPNNYIRLNTPDKFTSQLGRLSFDSFGNLAQINAGTDEVTITIFAQMMNYELSAPTSTLVALASYSSYVFEPQAQDEYEGDGPVSGPASAVAAAAGYLTEVPVIGPFALATQIGANAVGGIASLFGFSKPTIIDNVGIMRNTPFANLSVTDMPDTTQKLTVTSKQETTIDSRTVGMDGEDEMMLSFMTKKESFLRSFQYSTLQAQSDYIYAIAVNPAAEFVVSNSVSAGTQIQYTPTALSFASRPFEAWCGTLKYRFIIVASQFHRGRLGFIYDPVGPPSSDPYNTNFNMIVDLAETRDFTMEVKWQSDRPYCFVRPEGVVTAYSTSVTADTFTPNRETSNGALYVQVLNELTVPDGVTPVEILVYVSAGDDFELANPNGAIYNIQHSAFPAADISEYIFEPQAAATEIIPDVENAPQEEQETQTLTVGVSPEIMHKPLVYYGEQVKSFRQLCKRYSYYVTLSGKANVGTPARWFSFPMTAFPVLPGYSLIGMHVTSTPSSDYNYTTCNYMTYLRRAYACWRGSIRYKIRPTCGNVKGIGVTRLSVESERSKAISQQTPATYPSNGPIDSAQSVSKIAETLYFANSYAPGGESFTPANTMDALEVEIPYTLPVKFSQTTNAYVGPNTNRYVDVYPGGDRFNTIVYSQDTQQSNTVSMHVAAGEDFSFFAFTGAPRIWTFDFIPVPV